MSNASLLAELKKVECADATYAPAGAPLVLSKADGSYVWDSEGRRYIDLCAGFGVLALGHSPEIFTSVWRELADPPARKNLIHGLGDVYASREKIQLLAGLAAALPPKLSHGSLAVSGSQAVETALKTAFLATRRAGVIAFQGAYHGVDFGVLPVSGRRDFSEPFLPWIAHDKVEFCEFGGAAEAVRAAVKKQEASGIGTAAILVEPVQGRGGVRAAGTEWLQSLRQIADESGALLIYDEIFCGLGRAGVLTHAALVPCDILCLGKALGGGLPLSACFGTMAAMGHWPPNQGEALHTGTFFGHPLACRLGLLTLQEIIENKLCERSERVGRSMRAALTTQLQDNPLVAGIRGQGLMNAVVFREAGAGAAAMTRLQELGVIAIPCGERGECLSITPALTIAEDLLEEACGRLVEVCRTLK